MKIRHSFLKGNNQIGTLLLDSLTAIAILAIVFAVSYPNYARARLQAAVGTDAQQLDSINTAIQLYANDHKGAAPANAAISATVPGANYMQSVPVSPLGTSAYVLGTGAVAPAPYVIVDPNAAADNTLLGNYKDVTGAACSDTDLFLAEDPVHGVYCAATDNG